MAEFAIDYLDSLSTVVLAERQAQLREPLYSSLLQVLFPHMHYPQGFTTWDDWVDDDEEAFHRFRQVTSEQACVLLVLQNDASLVAVAFSCVRLIIVFSHK